MKPEKPLKYFLYVRKSTEEEERQVLSIQSQIDEAKKRFPDLDIIEVISESKSAFKPYNRPEFARMLERIQAGEAQGIISWHPDRISRNEIDAATVTYYLRTGVILDLKFCSYNFDNSPEGIMFLQNSLSQSQYSSAKLSKDVKRGMDNKRANGHRPNRAPAGYLNDKAKEKGLKDVIKDPERFDLIRKAWDLMLTGTYSIKEIMVVMNDEWGYRTRKTKKMGGTPMYLSGLYDIFTNLFYTGKFEHEGAEMRGAHPPMVTLEEYDRVQDLLGRKGRPRPKVHQFAFTGLVRCGECHGMVTAEEKSKYIKTTVETKLYSYYHCTHKKRCSQKSVTLPNIEGQIDLAVSQITIRQEFLEAALEELERSDDVEILDRTLIHKQQMRALLAANEELDELAKMRRRKLIDDADYLKQKQELTVEINRLEELTHDTNERAAKWRQLTIDTFEFATYARYNFEHGGLQDKRKVLVGIGSNPVLKDGLLRFEANKFLEPIKLGYAAIEAEYDQVITDENTSIERKDELLLPIYGKWSG